MEKCLFLFVERKLGFTGDGSDPGYIFAERLQRDVNKLLKQGWVFNCFVPGPSEKGVTVMLTREVADDEGVSHEPD